MLMILLWSTYYPVLLKKLREIKWLPKATKPNWPLSHCPVCESGKSKRKRLQHCAKALHKDYIFILTRTYQDKYYYSLFTNKNTETQFTYSKVTLLRRGRGGIQTLVCYQNLLSPPVQAPKQVSIKPHFLSPTSSAQVESTRIHGHSYRRVVYLRSLPSPLMWAFWSFYRGKSQDQRWARALHSTIRPLYFLSPSALFMPHGYGSRGLGPWSQLMWCLHSTPLTRRTTPAPTSAHQPPIPRPRLLSFDSGWMSH